MPVMPLGLDPSLCFINGDWVPSTGGAHAALINPSDGSTLCDIARGTDEDIDRAVTAASEALRSEWGKATAAERGRVLAKIGHGMLQHIDELAQLEAMDVGKPLKQARADVVALARYMEFYAGACDKVHGETIPYLDGYTVYTLREPHGVTGHIIPWNYPMQIIGRSVGAALAMGNAAVLKPAEEACLTALAFAEIARAAGLPRGALNVVPGLGAEAGAALTRHSGVNHVSFTGSVGVGKLIQETTARNVVPVTLELGGKSPQLVFDDADIDAALPFLVNAGVQNAGQTCSAASRILVQRGAYDRVVAEMGKRYDAFLAQGDGLEVAGRGKIVANAPSGGAYVAPVLYAGVCPDHVLAQEEIFGPVQVIIPFETEQEALEIANGTQYGLVAAVWSQNGGRQMRLAKQPRAGQGFLNNYGAGGGVELPFGGTGLSGHGREKGFEALYGFSTLKTIAAYHM